MHKKSVYLSVAILLAVFVSLISVQAQDKPTRTYYDSLTLDTPEATVKTFAAAFAKEDFQTVFMILAPKAQMFWQRVMANFSVENLVKPEYAKEAFNNIPKYDQWETIEYWYLFDSIMEDAAQHDALLIDLRGEVTIDKSTESQTSDGTAVVDVATTVEGIDGAVVFRLVQSPSKRWRVLQVIVPDGDESKIPWSVPSSSES